jgi:hypothetical protein
MFKRFVLIAGLCLAVSVPTLAVETSGLKQLNAQVLSMLTPLQNATTQANLVFKKVRTDSAHALDLSVHGDYKKTGPANTLELKLSHFHYHFGDGSSPWTRFNAFIGVDLTKLLPQDQINQLIPQLQETLQGLVKEFAQDYGDAATITVQTSNEKKDAQGNYVSLEAKIGVTIDLDKLPATTPKDSVMFTGAKIHLSVDLTKGADIRGVVYSNPAYSDFAQDQQGLKEYLNLLLKQDPQTLQDIGGLYQELDDLAGGIVNGQDKAR